MLTKRTLLLCLIVALSLAPVQVGHAEVVEIEFWYAWGGAIDEAFRMLADRFNEQNDDIRVVTRSVPGDANLNEAFMVAMASGLGPDVIRTPSFDFPTWVSANYIQPLDEYMERAGRSQDEFLAPYIVDATYDGRLYGLPFSATYTGFYFLNVDLFESVGLDHRQPPVTWTEVRDAARSLTRRAGDGTLELMGFRPWGLGTNSYSTAQTFFALLLQNGGQIFDPTTGKLTFQDPLGVEAVRFITDLHLQTGAFDMPYPSGFTSPAGRVGMSVGASGDQAGIRQNAEFDWEMGPLMMNSVQTGIGWGHYYSISRDTPHPEAAWRWIDFLTQPENDLARAQMAQMPGTWSSLTDPYFREDRHLARHLANIQNVFVAPEVRVVPSDAVTEFLTPRLIQAYRGEIPAEQALQEAAQLIEVRLAQSE